MTVRRRGKRGIWLYDFMIRGVRYREAIPEAQTKHEALQVEAEARRAVYEGRYGRQMRSVSFEKFAREVFKPYAEQNRKRHTQDWKIVEQFIQFFKGRALQEIPPMLVEQYKKKAMQTDTPLGSKPKASTVNQKLSVLHRVFSLAVENGYLSQNPVSNVKRLKESDRRERVMTFEEEMSIRGVLEGPKYYNVRLFFLLAVNTGMRAMEILGLKFSEVDFERKEIRLPYQRTKEAKDKVIPLNSPALSLLMDTYRERGEGTVFGHGACYGRVADLWREACKEAKVTNLHIHDLRHTFASRLLERGERETDINQLLGHSKLRMTSRYLHSSAESRRRAVESLAQVCHDPEQKVVNFQK
jgi:integrase